MKLCAVTPFPPGMRGIGEYGYHILRGLKALGAVEEVVALADADPAAPPAEEVAGIQVRRVWRRNSFATLFRLHQHIREVGPHLVWFNLGLSMFGDSPAKALLGLVAPWTTKLMGYPTVVTLHELVDAVDLDRLGLPAPHLVRWGGGAVTALLLQADLVCVTLQRYAEVLRKEYGAANVVHIPLGLFHEPVPVVHVNGHQEILMLAAHGPHKGLSVLLEAYQQLRPSMSRLELTILGEDHPRFPGYLRTVKAHGPGPPGIRWLGYLKEEELHTRVQEASIVVVPTLATTGSSSVLHRAAAAGKAIVASDLPDLRAVAEEEDLWVEFTPPGSPAALARTLQELFNAPERQKAMGLHNLAAARTMTLEHTCARYSQLFSQLLSPLPQSATAS